MAGGPSSPLLFVNCGTNGSDVSEPRLKVTLCGGTGYPKTFLGESWQDGESKIVCPDFYTDNSLQEIWTIVVGGHRIDMQCMYPKDTYQANAVHVVGPTVEGTPELWVGTIAYGATKNLQVGLTTFYPTKPDIVITSTAFNTDRFGYIKTTTGFSIKWQPISGSGEPWPSWKNTTNLTGIYATTLIDETACI